jgi:RNA polymerase sigma-70 factor (ECF subfamily)
MVPKVLAATVDHSSLDVLRASGSSEQGRPPRDEVASGMPARASGANVAELDFEDVYARHFDFVWRSLRLLGVPAEVVEDATQDTFSVVSRQLARFEGRSALRTWLFAILQRVAANHRRTARRKLQRLEPLEEGLAAPGPTAHARAEAAEAIDLIQSFCDTLDLERRAVFVLALLEELPAPEVAQALAIPINTVYSRVRSLREGLRRALERREVEHD